MDRLRQHWKNRPYKRLRVAGMFLITIVLTVAFYASVSVSQSNTQTISDRFNVAVQSDVARLQSRFEVYADTLYSGRALFRTKPSVSRQDWTTFVEAQNIKQRYPGIGGISYVSVINRDQATNYTAKLNAERLPSEKKPINIYPHSVKGQLAVLTYLAPSDLSQHAIGFDMFTSPVRARALLAARDSGLPQTSEPIELVANQQNNAPSLLVVMPVYQPGSTISNIAWRRVALQGFCVLSVNSKQMLDTIFKAPLPHDNLSVTISAGKQVIYQNGTAAGNNHGLRKNVSIEAAGQTWNLTFSAPAAFALSKTGSAGPYGLLIGGIFAALALSLLLYSMIKMRLLKHHDN
jgi:CHASE1-domain containing sensor protein